MRDIAQSIVGAPYFSQQRIRTLQVLPTDRKLLLRHRIQPRIPILLRADKRIADHIKDAGTEAVFLCDPIEQCEAVRTRLLLRRTLRPIVALDHDLVDAAHRKLIREPALDLDHKHAHILDEQAEIVLPPVDLAVVVRHNALRKKAFQTLPNLCLPAVLRFRIDHRRHSNPPCHI